MFNIIFDHGARAERRRIARELYALANQELMLTRAGSETYRIIRSNALKEAAKMLHTNQTSPSDIMRQDLINTGRILERDDILRLIDSLPIKSKSIEKLYAAIKERTITNEYDETR